MNDKNITLTPAQEHFLKCALDLKNNILNFGLSDKEFKEDVGFTISEMIEATDELGGQLEE